MGSIINSELSAQFDRLPPHSIECEMCVIASMMLDKEIIAEVVQIIDREAFYQADHQILWDVLVKLYEENSAIDIPLIVARLESFGLFNEVGGKDYLITLLSTVPSSAHGKYYAEKVREKYVLRRLISASNEVLRDCYSPHEDVGEVADRAEQKILAATARRVNAKAMTLGDVMADVYETAIGDGERGIQTGFFELDDMLNGLQNGEMIIVGARPSQGKTAFATDIISHIAIDEKLPVAFFSMEMSQRQVCQRMLCSRSGVDSHKLRRGMLAAEEYQALLSAMKEFKDAKIFVDDSCGLTVLDLRAKSRLLHNEYGIKAVVVDYLQLMSSNIKERVNQIGEISRGIKALARELNLPVIALSQLNRQSETRENHRPRMADLRESGNLEQDADVIMLLHREDYYRMSDPNPEFDNIAEIIVAKQRNGPVGSVKLIFDSKSTSFRNPSQGPQPI